VVPDALVQEAARHFALLSDPTRLRLLCTLQAGGELAVGELARRSRVARENVSQHLARLAAARLVVRRREGTSVIYSVSDPTLAQVCALVCASLQERARTMAEV
jgi:ArsR family transcriptional regulator